MIALALLTMVTVVSVPLWPSPRIFARRWPLRGGTDSRVAVLGLYAVPVVLLAIVALLFAVRPTVHQEVAVLLGVVAAAAAGGPVTMAVLELADRSGDTDPVAADPPVLRGGAWIGALERLAVVVTLLGGWPEGLAVVLGIKGLARYPELRAPAAAERFIIGTFTSVLWAAACAGVVTLTR